MKKLAEVSENSEWIAASDPCTIELGTQWHIPTLTDWNNIAVAGSWTSWQGPWSCGLQLHAAGIMSQNTLFSRGEQAWYWSSSNSPVVDDSYGGAMIFGDGYCTLGGQFKSLGLSVRCIRDN